MIDDLPSWSERPGVTPDEAWNREQAGPIDAFLADAGSYTSPATLICAGISRDGAGTDNPGLMAAFSPGGCAGREVPAPPASLCGDTLPPSKPRERHHRNRLQVIKDHRVEP